MDMSDVKHTHEDPPGGRHDTSHWCRVLAQVGCEAAGPLTAALDRVNDLVASGRIERNSLRALRQEIEDARRAAMLAQQLARHAAGRLRQSHERLDLTQMLRDVLAQRGPELQARGLALHQSLRSAEVIVDASLLFGLLNTLLDWAAPRAIGQLALKLDLKTWPVHARLACRFVHLPPDEMADPAAALPAIALDTLEWRLLEQIALTMGLGMQRADTASECTLVLEFPRTVNDEMEGVSALELGMDAPVSGPSTRPLAGSHVLVVAPRREMRMEVRDAIQHMGLIIDFVASIDEARDFCRGGLPHVVVYASALAGERFDALRNEINASAAGFVFIEIDEEGEAFEVSGFDGKSVARVGRDALATGLPSALVFELSKNL